MRMKKRKTIESHEGENIFGSTSTVFKKFHVEFLTETQKIAYESYLKNDILFLIGLAGSGKSHLAVSFAVQEILEKTKEKIALARPVVSAGEQLGFLPGDLASKIFPYLLPVYDCMTKMCGKQGERYREYVDKKTEITPLAYLRGRTFDNCVCILDEAQNCTYAQLKLFLTRLGNGSKMIITGDPTQSDLRDTGLMSIVGKIKHLEGVGVVEFGEECIVRHPLVREIVGLI
jgi:phosphate starvation-inducible PhoH-like protein